MAFRPMCPVAVGAGRYDLMPDRTDSTTRRNWRRSARLLGGALFLGAVGVVGTSCGEGLDASQPPPSDVCGGRDRYYPDEPVDVAVKLDTTVQGVEEFAEYIGAEGAPGAASGGAIQTLVPDHDRRLVFLKFDCLATAADLQDAIAFVTRWPTVSAIEQNVTPEEAFR